MLNKIKQLVLDKVSFEDLEKEYLKRFKEDIHYEYIDEKQANEIYYDMSRVEDIDRLLESLIKSDRIRFFNSTSEQQEVVRGGFSRTIYLLKNIRKSRETGSPKKKSVKKDRFTSPRHA